MKATAAFVVSLGLLPCLANADAIASPGVYASDDELPVASNQSVHSGSPYGRFYRDDRWMIGSGSNTLDEQPVFYRQVLDHDASSLYAYIGLPNEPASQALPSVVHWAYGLEGAGAASVPGWDTGTAGPNGVTVGYAWNKLKVEGSAFSIGSRDEVSNGKRDLALLDSTSSRVSYRPNPNWILQFSRGNLSNLDQLETGDELRRTALSASYIKVFSNADWRTTFAWGRNSRKSTGTTLGYLMESTLRFNGANTVFGRLERARANENGIVSENSQRENFRMNKLTFGYFYDMSRTGSFRYDVGALVTRYLTSPTTTSLYNNDRNSGMMFVRFWLP